MNLHELGEDTDSLYDQEHTCEENHSPKADRLVHCIANRDEAQDQWQMHNIHYASADEVSIGEAEYEGQITYHTMIPVHFCPFCGMHLQTSPIRDRLSTQ